MSQSTNKYRQNWVEHTLKKSHKTKIVAVTINLSQNTNTELGEG